MLQSLVIIIAIGLIVGSVFSSTRIIAAWQESKGASQTTVKKWVWFSGAGLAVFLAPFAYVLSRLIVSIVLGFSDVGHVLGRDGGFRTVREVWDFTPSAGSLTVMFFSAIVCVSVGVLMHHLAKKQDKTMHEYMGEKFDDDTPVDYDALKEDAEDLTEKSREHWRDSMGK